jgi:N-acyl-D-amino-acid deacylase
VTEFDLIIRGGTVIDGSGNIGRRADVGVPVDRIVAIGDLRSVEDAAVAELTGVSAARS